MRIRRVCFTLNNYTEEEFIGIKELCNIDERITYMIVGKEVGTQGTSHLQGYVEFNTSIRFETIRKLFYNKAHIEGSFSTVEKNKKYCSKGEEIFEYGEPHRQGERTDLDNVRRSALDEGMRTITSYCNRQQISVAEKYLTYNEVPRNFKPEVTWIWGDSGSGKTRLAFELCDDDSENLYVKNTNDKWWDGYDGHGSVIIDDFRHTMMDFNELLTLLDRYPRKVEVKGGFRQFKAKKIIITTIVHPEDERMYPFEDSKDKKQLIRRIDKIIKMK